VTGNADIDVTRARTCITETGVTSCHTLAVARIPRIRAIRLDSSAKRNANIKRLDAAWLGMRLPTPGGHRKSEINPMNGSRLSHPSQAPRCGARTRAGMPCQRAPIRGRNRCRLHGGLSPGAPKGSQNGNYTNGEWTAEAIEERRWLRSLVRTFAKTEQIDE
jgi:hypothetical protein